MRRGWLLLMVLALAGCGGEQTVSPRPATVQGSVPSQTSSESTTTSTSTSGGTTTSGGGGGADGKALFASNGCGSCHTFEPAGATAKIGPDLDKLAQYAKQANKGSLEQFVKDSIVDPNAYVQPGYQPIMPSFKSLPPDQVDALVAFLTQKS
jgi:cytochrome c551/c552